MMKQSVPYAVELDGRLVVCQDGVLKDLSALNAIKGECRIVSDFENAIARIMTVEADTRYVELMISRKLQETGEFDEPVTVITHWKKKRGRNTTDIFFTALPSRRYFQYLEWVSEHKNNLMVLPIQAVLMAMVQKYGKDQPVAAVLQHGRFAEVLIGTRRKIWFADRVVVYDESDDQISSLWETVRSDMETAGRNHHQAVGKIVVATWFDSGPLPLWPDENAPEVIELDAQPVEWEGQTVEVSLPGVIPAASVGQCLATAKDKLFFWSRFALPLINIALLSAALLLVLAGGWYRYQSAGWQTQIQKNLQDVERLQTKVPKSIETIPYEATLSFVEGLWSSRKLPTYGQILADMGRGMEAPLLLENIKANYAGSKVEVKAYGTADAPFEVAHQAYQALKQRLVRRGYQVIEDRFDTRIHVSSFVLHFVKEAR